MAKKSPIEENRNDAVNQNQTVRQQLVEDSGLVFSELNEIITAALKGDVQPLFNGIGYRSAYQFAGDGKRV